MMMMKRFGTGTLLPAAILAATPLAAQEASRLTLSDYDAIADLSSTAMSPDGTRIAFIVSHVDKAADARRGDVAVVSSKGGEPQVVATGDVDAPAWSPDGKTLGWIAKGQLHLAARDALGMVRKIEADPSTAGIQAFAWSPDGRSIAYLAKMDVVRKLPDKSFEFAEADYLGTSFLARDAGAPPAQVWIVDVASGGRRRLIGITGYPQDVVWQADGRALAVQVQPGGSSASAAKAKLLSVPVDGGVPQTLIGAPGQMGTGARLDVTNDGAIAFQHFRGIDPWTHANSIGVYRSGKVEIVSQKLDQQIDEFKWLPGGNGLIARAVERNRERMWWISGGGAVTPIDLGAVNLIGGLDVGANGAISFVGSSADRPADIYYLPSPKAKLVRLTHFGDALAHRKLGKVERVTWAGGGQHHDGVLVFPPDYDKAKRYPLLVDIHGGPEASSIDAFDFSPQYHAANGWIVFQPNYRGSTGQGDHYQTLVTEDLLKGAGEDVIAGVDKLVATLPIDPKRIAITGYSWGGVMTSWLIGHDRRWCAAVPGGGVVDFAAYYDQSAFAIWMPTVKGSPHVGDNILKYREVSPLTYLGNATTPTMVIHNAGDPNAPVTQALTLYHLLKERGVKTKMVLRAIDSHDFGSPFDHKQMYDLPLKWITENCRSD